MTNEELLSVAEIVEKLTDRFNAQAALHRERFDEHVKLIASMKADHEAKMVEHRAAFGARTEADEKIIAGLRSTIGAARMAVLERDSLISERAKLQSIINEQSASAKEAGEKLGWTANESPIQAVERVVRERDGLLTQVQDMRAEIKRLRNDERKAYQDGEALRAEVADLRGIVDMVHASLGIKRGDHIGNAIAQLKAQTPKRSHPVAVGEYLRRLTGFSTTPAGEVAQVLHVDCDAPTTEYTVKRPNGQQGVWSESGCEPCDSPAADHDTPAGKAAAEIAVSAEPVAEEIKVGDLVEVVSNTGLNTWLADVGSFGTVASIETIMDLSVRLAAIPGKKNALGGYVSLSDVRKVTT